MRLARRYASEASCRWLIPAFLRYFSATPPRSAPRQRFALVVNNLSALAWTTREIKMTSDGTPWRPHVHGVDTGKAICRALEQRWMPSMDHQGKHSVLIMRM